MGTVDSQSDNSYDSCDYWDRRREFYDQYYRDHYVTNGECISDLDKLREIERYASYVYGRSTDYGEMGY